MTEVTQYIPIQQGQSQFLRVQPILNDLLGQVGYEYENGYVVFTEDLAARAIPVTAVDMQLAVMDFEAYSDYDMLPLPADMAADVVKEVYALLMPTPIPDSRVDSNTEEVIQRRVIE